jgi:hypothetical protein
MKVILKPGSGQVPTLCRAWREKLQILATSLFGLMLLAGISRAETHWNLQSVTETGASAWGGSPPCTVVGVLVTDPGEMLDAAPNFIPWNEGAGAYQLGAEWQVAVQAALADDRGGSFCYMGQNYGNMPWIHNSDLSYGNEAWTAEINRLTHDPATGHTFKKGDLVAVSVNQALFYGGKLNINEGHSIDPAFDFTISLVVSNYGLPSPEVISLASLVRPDDTNAATHEDIFDVTRATGGEHWQGMRVRINGLTLVTNTGWNPANAWGARKCTVTDGEGRYFTLRHPRYSLGDAPTNRFDAIGVLNQESGSGSDGTFGYELFVQEITPSAEAIVTIGTKTVLSWPASLVNYRLQSADSLSNPDWMAVTNLPGVVNGRNTVIIEPTGAQKFFRLERMQ